VPWQEGNDSKEVSGAADDLPSLINDQQI